MFSQGQGISVLSDMDVKEFGFFSFIYCPGQLIN